MSLRAALMAAIVSGLIAGGVVTFFHLVFAEPLIDRAIELEREHSQGHGETSELVLSRRAQRVGLLVGHLVYGIVWGLLLGVGLHVAERQFSGWSPGTVAAWLALALGWSTAIFPFLKYPANPPGVGNPETVGYRQILYVTFIVLSAIGVVVALVLRARLSGRWVSAVAVGYLAYAVLLFALIPGNPDPITTPIALVTRFRVVSLGGLLLFWAVMAGMVAWLVTKQSRATVSV